MYAATSTRGTSWPGCSTRTAERARPRPPCPTRYGSAHATHAIRIRYVVDMAEIPTFQETQEAGLVADGGHPSVAPWLARSVTRLAGGLRLEVNGTRLALTPSGSEIIFPPGAGGLPTLKLGVVYTASPALSGAREATVRYADENYAGRAGWKEVIVASG